MFMIVPYLARVAVTVTGQNADCDFTTARHTVLSKMENPQMKERAMQEDSKTSRPILPNEILAMIFEQGARLRARKQKLLLGPHFGSIVSHVSRRWRAPSFGPTSDVPRRSMCGGRYRHKTRADGGTKPPPFFAGPKICQ